MEKALFGLRMFVYRRSVNKDLSCVGPENTGSHAKERALSCTVGPDQTEHPAGGDGDGKITDRPDMVIMLGDMNNLDHKPSSSL